MRFGRARYFRPVCILRLFPPRGYYGGPVGYEKVPAAQRGIGPLILEAAMAGKIPLHVAEDLLDREENQT